MIKEQDLLEAIAECQGERNPDARTCRNLAAFYTILDHIQEKEVGTNSIEGYSFAEEPKVEYQSNSEFFQYVADMDVNDILALFDEVMETLQIVNPRLYDSIIRKVT